ncbi:MAG: hypothetical protein ACFFCQ_04250 [Promethearchaeota archaeon]
MDSDDFRIFIIIIFSALLTNACRFFGGNMEAILQLTWLITMGFSFIVISLYALKDLKIKILPDPMYPMIATVAIIANAIVGMMHVFFYYVDLA